MNIEGAWKRGYTGKNIVVTILDDGIERTHPDLMQNYVSVYCGQNAFPPGKQWNSCEDVQNGGKHGDFPGGSGVNIPPANAGDAGAIPGLGRCPREGNGNQLQYSCLEVPWTEEPDSPQSIYSPWGHKRVRHNLVTKQQQKEESH